MNQILNFVYSRDLESRRFLTQSTEWEKLKSELLTTATYAAVWRTIGAFSNSVDVQHSGLFHLGVNVMMNTGRRSAFLNQLKNTRSGIGIFLFATKIPFLHTKRNNFMWRDGSFEESLDLCMLSCTEDNPRHWNNFSIHQSATKHFGYLSPLGTICNDSKSLNAPRLIDSKSVAGCDGLMMAGVSRHPDKLQPRKYSSLKWSGYPFSRLWSITNQICNENKTSKW